MKVTLYIQRTTSGKKIKHPTWEICDLSLRNGEALAFDGDGRLSAVMKSAEVVSISKDGMMLKGFETQGGDEDAHYRQAWWVTV